MNVDRNLSIAFYDTTTPIPPIIDKILISSLPTKYYIIKALLLQYLTLWNNVRQKYTQGNELKDLKNEVIQLSASTNQSKQNGCDYTIFCIITIYS